MQTRRTQGENVSVHFSTLNVLQATKLASAAKERGYNVDEAWHAGSTSEGEPKFISTVLYTDIGTRSRSNTLRPGVLTAGIDRQRRQRLRQ